MDADPAQQRQPHAGSIVSSAQPAPGVPGIATSVGRSEENVQSPQTTASVQAFFSPHGGAQDAIIREIDGAKEWIRLQAYSYTSVPISEALLRANKRGVKIKAILDKSNQTATYTGATFLQNAGIAVLIDGKHAIAHSKIMLIDGATVITGSFNFTKAAEESNAENLLVLKNCPDLVNAYANSFRAHEAHSTAYARK